MQYINDKGKHNKFWSYEIDDKNNVVIRWGRMGTKGQSKAYAFNSKWDADHFVDKKIGEKIRKGYKKVETEEFDLKKLQAELVGAGCKIEELCFVKKLHKIDNRNLYETVKEESALADPEYDPLIYASLRFTGNRGSKGVLISPEKVFACEELGTSRWLGGDVRTYRLENVEEIEQYAPEELLWLKKSRR